MSRPIITVTITGAQGAGKSISAMQIAATFEALGLKVKLEDGDSIDIERSRHVFPPYAHPLKGRQMRILVLQDGEPEHEEHRSTREVLFAAKSGKQHRAGLATLGEDGSLSIRLDVLPVDGRLVIPAEKGGPG